MKQNKFSLFKHFLNPKTIRNIALILLVAIFASTCVLPVSEAQAAKAAKIISTAKKGGGGAVKAASGWAGMAITAVVVWLVVDALLVVATAFVKYMLSPDQALYNLNSAFVQVGWKMVRDICNLFFLLALLFIAFCTVLQIERYHAKKTLLTLILMALLINFSKPIAIFIFDGSQLLMQWFLKGSGEGDNIVRTLTIFGNIGPLLKSALSQNSILNGGADLIFGIIFLFVFDVVMICLGLFLLIRIVAMWLIVIVSPVAFLAMIIPDFRKLSTQWWDALFRYSYVGPAIAFFLWLASKMRSVQGQIGRGDFLVDAHPMMEMPILIPYLITIIFLFAALMMANQFGIYFSQTITKGANKFIWRWAALRGLKMVDRDLLTKVGLSPTMWIHAWRARQKDLDEKKYGYAAATARDWMGRVMERGKRDPSFYRNMQKALLRAKYKKEQDSVSTQDRYIIREINKLQGKKDLESQLRTEAFLMTMSDNKDLNEWMKLRNKDMDPYALRKDLVATLEKVGMGEEDIARALFHIGNNNFAQGFYAGGGMAGMDENGKWKVHSNEEQKAWVLGKIPNVDVQKMMINFHPDNIVVERGKIFDDEGRLLPLETAKKRGDAVDVHDIGKEIAAYLSKIGAPQMTRPRGDTLVKLHDVNDKIREFGPVFADALDRAVREKKGEEKAKEPSRAEIDKEMLEVMKEFRSALEAFRNR